MLYYLFDFLERAYDFPGAGMFEYITFRAALAAITSLTISLLFGKSLINLWDGLGAVSVLNPDIKYLFGKFTMYTDFNVKARDLILNFLNQYFPDKNKLVFPFQPVELQTPIDELNKAFSFSNYDDDYKTLVRAVRELNENIPPLVNAYMNLSPTMKTFGTSMNAGFGDVEETGILITINDIYDQKKQRHIESFIKQQK
jgi:hypothetical protein